MHDSASRDEFHDLAHEAFAPEKAQNGGVKAVISALQRASGVTWNRARDLIRKKVSPKAWEMDLVRELTGRWCRETRKPKADLMQTLLCELRELKDDCKAFIDRRRAKREKAKSIRHSEREELYRALSGDRA